MPELKSSAFDLLSDKPNVKIMNPQEAYDSVTEGSRNEDNEKIINLSANILLYFKNHPFEIQPERITDLCTSIATNGIIQPLIVRESKEKPGYYEIIAGHHRFEAGKLENIPTFPCKIVNANDDLATEMMFDTNIQRGIDNMKPSEIIAGITLKYNAQKRQGKRTDISFSNEEGTSRQVGEKLESNVSARMVSRYVRLGEHLDSSLISLLDADYLGIVAAVEISYIDQKLQAELAKYLLNNTKKITIKQAEDLRGLNAIKFNEIEEYFNPSTISPKKASNKIAFKRVDIMPNLPSHIQESDDNTILEYVLDALEYYTNKNECKK